MTNMLKSLIGLDDVELDVIESIMTKAKSIERCQLKQSKALDGCILAPLFFQESSRTFVNSTSSFIRMGGTVLPINLENTRLNEAWSEPIRDFCQLLNSCANLAIVRSPDVTTVLEFEKWTEIPLINAGNGAGTGSEHPMQTLVDLFIIQEKYGKAPINLLMIGGKHIRTTRTQTKLFTRLGFKVDLIPSSIEVENSDMNGWYEQHCEIFNDVRNVDLSKYQVIYHNGADEDSDARPGASINLNRKLLDVGRFDGVVMHSLPRLTELDHDLDDTKYNAYFLQMQMAGFVYQSVFHHMI